MHTGARARKQKYISIYISLYMKTFLKMGVYIYIYPIRSTLQKGRNVISSYELKIEIIELNNEVL